MKFKDHLERSAPFALMLMWSCLIVGPTLWIVSAALKMTNMTSAEIASWVQAIGAIAAIGLAIWIPNRQRSFERKEAEEKRRALLLVFLVECEWVIDITQKDSANLDVRMRLIRDLISGVRLLIDTDTDPARAASCLGLKYNLEGLLWELEVNEIELAEWLKFSNSALQRIDALKEKFCADIMNADDVARAVTS